MRLDQGKPKFSARTLAGVDDPFFAFAESRNSCPFQTRRFVESIVRHVVDDSSKLLLIGVTDQRGDAVALFPFICRRRVGLAIIEGLDFGLSDYFAPIYLGGAALDATESDLLWQAVLAALPKAHAVTFKKLPRLIYGESHALSGAAFLKAMGAQATTLRLRDPDRRETFSPGHLSVGRDVRRKTRRLQQIGELDFAMVQTAEDVDACLEALVAFRRARFAELGRSDDLLDDRIVAFYRELASLGEKPPLGRLFALRIGAQIIAVVYGFCLGGNFTLIAIAMSPSKELQAGSPGLVALYRTLEWCAGEDFKFFDLSVGSLHYKTRFGAEDVELFEYQKALTPLGWGVVAEAAARRWVRHRLLQAPQLRRHFERIQALVSRAGAVR